MLAGFQQDPPIIVMVGKTYFCDRECLSFTARVKLIQPYRRCVRSWGTSNILLGFKKCLELLTREIFQYRIPDSHCIGVCVNLCLSLLLFLKNTYQRVLHARHKPRTFSCLQEQILWYPMRNAYTGKLQLK